MATKFQAQNIDMLFAHIREGGAQAYANGVRFFVAVEVDDGSWCALHADSADHACTLAFTWVDKLNARGCSCWALTPDGSPDGEAFDHVYASDLALDLWGDVAAA